jgi:hypothetical protein
MRTTDNYVFFWKDKLAQWNMLPFVDKNNIKYNCAEQYMMAKKALLFQDNESYHKIMSAIHPREQQALGRKVKNFNQKIWDANAVSIVYQGNLFKFEQNKELLDLLISTGDKILVEASPYDKIWGIGLSEDNNDILDINKWKGLNLLGFTLTNLRNNYLKKN